MAGCFPPISLKVLESMSQQRCVWYNVVQHEAALGGGAAGRRAGRCVASLEEQNGESTTYLQLSG